MKNGLDLFRSFPVGELMNAPDAGGGGGEAPSASGGQFFEAPAESGGQETEAPDGQAAAPDDDNADEIDVILEGEGEDDEAALPERFKKVRTALNKLKRRYGKAAPTLRQLRQAGVTDVSQLLTKAQQYDALSAYVDKNPKLRATLFGGSQDDPAEAPSTPTTPATFDRKTLPFTVSDDDPLTGFLANMAEQLHALSAENQRLKQTVTTDHTSRQQQAIARETEQWKAALDAALPDVPKELHRALRDAVSTAFEHRHRHRLPADKVIEHYLGDFRKSKTNPKPNLAAGASKERGAAANSKQWPAHMAGGGVPAPAHRAKESLRDVHKRLRAGI